MSAEVNERSAAVAKMGAEWPMLEALMGGTAAMRAAGPLFLPKWENEELAALQTRTNVSTLFPAYRRTVSVMAGKPFSKAITFEDDVPAKIKEWADDIDREGVNLHSFCAEMFRESFYGLCGILVDAPKIADLGRDVTVADQRAADVRPYFVRVLHNQILGWRVETINGKRVLTQLRLAQPATVPDGDYGEKIVQRVRVLERGSFRVMELAKSATGVETWSQVDGGMTGLDYIPFAPIYGFREGFMVGSPPLRDLAYLNVKHWQSQSDQDNILHVARVPILFMTGADAETTLTVGANAAVKAPLGSTLEFVELKGGSIDAGQKSLEALEEQMIQAGAELLVKKPGDRSATESANDAEANKSDLQRMVEDFEDRIDEALQMMADYASLPDGGHVSLFKDFGAATLQAASGQLMLSLEQGGVISQHTLIEELKRRGELSAEVNAEEEQEKIAEQGQALGMMNEDPPAEDPPEEDPPADDPPVDEPAS